MDKYEFNIKVEQIKKLINKSDYETAMKIADTIDWRRVRNTNLLSMVATVYEKNEEYQEAKDILLLAFERAPIGKRLLYKLTELALKEGNTQEAEAYYREFCDLAPDDPRQNLLRYLILKEKGAPTEQLIHSLESYISIELDEKWMYELAEMYYHAGMKDDCVRMCDKIMLMFGLGQYVDKAMELKVQFAPLTQYQMDLVENRDKYEARLRAVEQEFNGSYHPAVAVQDEEYEDEQEEAVHEAFPEDLEAEMREAEVEEKLAAEMSKISIEDYSEEDQMEKTRPFTDLKNLKTNTAQVVKAMPNMAMNAAGAAAGAADGARFGFSGAAAVAGTVAAAGRTAGMARTIANAAAAESTVTAESPIRGVVPTFSEYSGVQQPAMEAGYRQSDYDQPEYTDDGYESDGYSQEGYGGTGYTEDSYSQETYGGTGYAEDSYSQEAYGGTGYAEDSCSQEAYGGTGYAEDSCSQETYGGTGYAKDNYSQKAYGGTGYAEDDHSQGVYGKNGYVGDGYGQEVYDQPEYDGTNEVQEYYDQPEAFLEGSVQGELSQPVYLQTAYGQNGYEQSPYQVDGIGSEEYNTADFEPEEADRSLYDETGDTQMGQNVYDESEYAQPVYPQAEYSQEEYDQSGCSAEEALEGHYVMIEDHLTDRGLEVAVETLKYIHRELGTRHQVAKITGEKLNNKGIFTVADKIVGKDLIVEQAGALSDIVLEELDEFITEDKSGMNVILIDSPRRINIICMHHPSLEAKFERIANIEPESEPAPEPEFYPDTEPVYHAQVQLDHERARQEAAIAAAPQEEPEYEDEAYEEYDTYEEPEPVRTKTESAKAPVPTVGRDEVKSDKHAEDELSAEEFAQYACQYASDIDCSIAGKSMLALYEKIEIMEEDGIPLTKASAEQMIEEAADKAEKPSFGKLLKGIVSPKYDKDGLLILKEEHFIN